MKNIYKYILSPLVEYIEIPSEKILSCETQGNNIVVYVIIDTEDKYLRKFDFQVIGTGHDIYCNIDDYTFLNTVKLENDTLVFHVFYKKI